ncbi:MAG: tetratricopeptide repeat protein [Spirochaetota bacterium]
MKNVLKKLSLILILLAALYSFSSKYGYSQQTDPAFNSIVEGNQLAEQGFLDKAYEKFTEAIELNPNNLLGYLNRAQILFFMWEYERAIEDFSNVIDMNEELDAAYNDRGQCYAYLGKLDNAIKDWTKSIELNPDPNNPAYYYRGAIYFILGDNKYKKDFKKALNFISQDAYFYDKIASFVGLNQNPQIFDIDIALEYSNFANEQTGWKDIDLLYTFAELNFQKSRDRESGDIDCYYIKRAVKILDRINKLTGYLKTEANGYYLYRGRKMYSVGREAGCEI